ncbi:MAG: hypothetical protein IKE73_03530 [Bacilli bacterium]|nr:hypothetical protein [Bacilli bacterium]
MKLSRAKLFLTSIGTFLLLALYPIAKILLQIKEVQNLYFSFGVIFYLLLMILLAIIDIIIVIYFIRYIIKNEIKNKALWIILILLFNIFIIPYFYMKYVEKEEKLLFNTMLYVLPIIVYIVAFGFGFYVYEDLNNQKITREKEIAETRNYYVTKDSKTTFTFGYGYKQDDVGEYDLYVINKDKSIVFSAFTYNTIDYEQRSVDEYLNKVIEDIKVDKKNFLEFSKKKQIKGEGYLINTISYEGQAEVKTKTKVTTSNCIYKLSIITFDEDPNYLISVIEVVPKAYYDEYKTELTDILKSVSVNFN